MDWRKALVIAPMVVGGIAYLVFAFEGTVMRALKGESTRAGAGRLLALARSGPEQAPRTPATHLRALGTVRFGEGEEAVEQDAELLLGGADRMRFRLGADGARNVFVLDGDTCMLLPSGSAEWQGYEAATLLDETLLRWELARFPWDWPEPLEDLRLPGPGRDADGSYARDTPRGRLVVDVLDGRPVRMRLLDEDAGPGATPRAEVGVQSWLPVGDNLRAQPGTLVWPLARRVETWTEVFDRALFLDRTFLPRTGADWDPGGGGLARPDLGDTISGSADRVALTSLVMTWLPEDAVAALPAGELPAGHWWSVDGERRLVLADRDALSGAAADALEDTPGLWLEWSWYARADGAAEDPGTLPQIIEQAGVNAYGAPWRLEVEPDGRRRLHVVRVRVARD